MEVFMIGNVYSTYEAAAIAGVTPGTFRQRVKRLKITSERKIGIYPLYSMEQIDRIKEGGRIGRPMKYAKKSNEDLF